MPIRLSAFCLAALLMTTSAIAQSAYSGWQNRSIKALSAKQTEDLLAGRGMSLALSAELNGHPGPKHVLELATDLSLTTPQKTEVEKLYSALQAEARAGGKKVLEAETTIDEQFAGDALNPGALEQAVLKAATEWGRLRWIHLQYHLRMRGVLTSDQVARYQSLRGYDQRHEHDQRH